MTLEEFIREEHFIFHATDIYTYQILWNFPTFPDQYTAQRQERIGFKLETGNIGSYDTPEEAAAACAADLDAILAGNKPDLTPQIAPQPDLSKMVLPPPPLTPPPPLEPPPIWDAWTPERK